MRRMIGLSTPWTFDPTIWRIPRTLAGRAVVVVEEEEEEEEGEDDDKGKKRLLPCTWEPNLWPMNLGRSRQGSLLFRQN